MLPREFVRVAVWGIGRQKEQAQFRTHGPYERANLFRAMSRPPIDDQENVSPGTFYQPLQKFDEDIGVDPAFVDDHEPHVAARRDRRDQARAVTAPVAWTIGVVPFLPHVRPA